MLSTSFGGDVLTSKNDRVPCEVYSRIVGYLRPTKAWNFGKQQEFSERTTFDPTKSTVKKGAPVKALSVKSLGVILTLVLAFVSMAAGPVSAFTPAYEIGPVAFSQAHNISPLPTPMEAWTTTLNPPILEEPVASTIGLTAPQVKESHPFAFPQQEVILMPETGGEDDFDWLETLADMTLLESAVAMVLIIGAPIAFYYINGWVEYINNQVVTSDWYQSIQPIIADPVEVAERLGIDDELLALGEEKYKWVRARVIEWMEVQDIPISFEKFEGLIKLLIEREVSKLKDEE